MLAWVSVVFLLLLVFWGRRGFSDGSTNWQRGENCGRTRC
jgi:hypothetical protein